MSSSPRMFCSGSQVSLYSFPCSSVPCHRIKYSTLPVSASILFCRIRSTSPISWMIDSDMVSYRLFVVVFFPLLPLLFAFFFVCVFFFLAKGSLSPTWLLIRGHDRRGRLCTTGKTIEPVNMGSYLFVKEALSLSLTHSLSHSLSLTHTHTPNDHAATHDPMSSIIFQLCSGTHPCFTEEGRMMERGGKECWILLASDTASSSSSLAELCLSICEGRKESSSGCFFFNKHESSPALFFFNCRRAC